MAQYDVRSSKSLLDAWRALGETQSLSEFLSSVEALTQDDRERTVDQALVVIDQLFAHLPLKEARHAVNSVQRLRILRQRLADTNDPAFHSEMIEIFKGLRDAHTNYGLPRPYAQRYAFLPFLMEEFFEGETRRFLVTRLLFRFAHATFRAGVEVTHWNGTPVERAVQMNANREEGSNSAARFAFGLSAMTSRALGSSLPPDEEWVIVTFRSGNQHHEIILPWRVWDEPTEPRPNLSVTDDGIEASLGSQRFSLSICSRVQELHLSRKHCFAAAAIEADERLAETRRSLRAAAKPLGDENPTDVDTSAADLSVESVIPTVLGFDVYQNLGKEFGYIRIRRFDHWPISEFINEFLRILELMPRDGLILDVRGNGGGYIWNGELLLQLFTPKTIEPEPFQFISTPLTRKICSDPEDGLSNDAAAERQELADVVQSKMGSEPRPVWAITLRGIDMPWHGSPGGGPPIVLDRMRNIVHAGTGEWLRAGISPRPVSGGTSARPNEAPGNPSPPPTAERRGYSMRTTFPRTTPTKLRWLTDNCLRTTVQTRR